MNTTIYSKQQKSLFLILAIVLSICIVGAVYWIYNKNIKDTQSGKEFRDAMTEVETFIGNRPWIPEWSEVVQKRTGIPIANLSFPVNSYSIPAKMIPYNMIIVDISSAMYLDGKGYVDPQTILLSNEWKELLGLLPAKVPYDYNRASQVERTTSENRRLSSLSQTVKSAYDDNRNCSVLSIFLKDCPEEKQSEETKEMIRKLKRGNQGNTVTKTTLSEPPYDPGYKDMLKWTFDKQRENDAIYQQFGFDELPEFKYDYYQPASKTGIVIDWDEYQPIVNKVFDQIKDKYLDATSGKMQCASRFDRCNLQNVDWRLIKAGKHKKTKELIMEGQLLMTDVRQMYILVRFVATRDTLYTAYLEGYEYRSKWLLDNEKWEGRDNEVSSVFNGGKPVRINSNPMLGAYEGRDGYLYSSSEKSEGMPRITNEEARQMAQARMMQMRDRESMFIPRCFGKIALTKSECEAVYSPDGNANKAVGVWDSMCKRNEDCPFYKANKNYPNEFGGCNDGVCQMPLGVTQISPSKYLESDRAICYRCIEGRGTHCCKDQEDRKMYPALKSPDYAFEGDVNARRPYF